MLSSISSSKKRSGRKSYLPLLVGALVFGLGYKLTWRKSRVMFWHTYDATVTSCEVNDRAGKCEIKVRYSYDHQCNDNDAQCEDL